MPAGAGKRGPVPAGAGKREASPFPPSGFHANVALGRLGLVVGLELPSHELILPVELPLHSLLARRRILQQLGHPLPAPLSVATLLAPTQDRFAPRTSISEAIFKEVITLQSHAIHVPATRRWLWANESSLFFVGQMSDQQLFSFDI